jgi:ribosomal protein S2
MHFFGIIQTNLSTVGELKRMNLQGGFPKGTKRINLKIITKIQKEKDMTQSDLTGISIKDMFDAGLHFGHQTKRWNP